MAVIEAILDLIAFMLSLVFRNRPWTISLFAVASVDIWIMFATSNPNWNSLCLGIIGANLFVVSWAAVLWFKDWVDKTQPEE